ncbi:MAG: hypothetical protein AAF594_06710 [Bacteroidota bacterium]
MRNVLLSCVFLGAAAASAQPIDWRFDIEGLPADSTFLIGLVNGPDGLYGLPNTYGLGVQLYDSSADEWQQLTYPLEGFSPTRALAVGPSGDLWVGVDRGLRHSTDGGRTWIRRGPDDAFNVVAILSPSHIVAGGARSEVGAYSSRDGGETWSRVSDALGFQQMEALESGTLLGVGSGGISRSTDGGATWRPVLAGRVTSVAEGAEGVLLAANQGVGGDPTRAGLYRSVDDGATWQLAALPQTPVTRVVLGDGGATVVVADGAVLVSTDLDTWTTVFDLDEDVVAFDAAADASGRVHLATPDGVLAASAPYSSWSLNRTGQRGVPDVRGVAVAEGTVFSVVQGWLFRRGAGEPTWGAVPGLVPTVVNVVEGPAASVYVGTAAGVLRSVNGGETWDLAGFEGDSVSVVAALPGGRVFAQGGPTDSGGYRTSGGPDDEPGPVVEFENPFYLSVAATPDGGAVACVRSDTYEGLWSSRDGGGTWSPFGPPLPCGGVAVSDDGSTVYTTRSPSFGVVASDDGGRTWRVLVENAALYRRGRDGTLLAGYLDFPTIDVVWSRDDGATWTRTSRPGPRLKYGTWGMTTDGDGDLYVATSHGLMRGAPTSAVSDDRRAPALTFSLNGPHPNPVRDRAAFRLETTGPTTASLDVFDTLGRRVASFGPRRFDGGVHSIVVDISALPPGLYLYRLSSTVGVAVRPGVVVR